MFDVLSNKFCGWSEFLGNVLDCFFLMWMVFLCAKISKVEAIRFMLVSILGFYYFINNFLK